MKSGDEARFRDFAGVQAPPLRRFAYLLCGDWHLAEDLMQTALFKLYRAWPRVQRREVAGAYVRKILIRTWLDERKKPWRRREERDGPVPDVADDSLDPAALTQLSWTRSVVRRALLKVPEKQRAVLVLRFYDELSVAEAAAVLGCSEGNVKSQTARGLAALGRAVEDAGTKGVISL